MKTPRKAARYADYCAGHLRSLGHELQHLRRRTLLQSDACALACWAVKIEREFAADTARRAVEALREAQAAVLALTRPEGAAGEGAAADALAAVRRAQDRVQEWLAVESEVAP